MVHGTSTGTGPPGRVLSVVSLQDRSLGVSVAETPRPDPAPTDGSRKDRPPRAHDTFPASVRRRGDVWDTRSSVVPRPSPWVSGSCRVLLSVPAGAHGSRSEAGSVVSIRLPDPPEVRGPPGCVEDRGWFLDPCGSGVVSTRPPFELTPLVLRTSVWPSRTSDWDPFPDGTPFRIRLTPVAEDRPVEPRTHPPLGDRGTGPTGRHDGTRDVFQLPWFPDVSPVDLLGGRPVGSRDSWVETPTERWGT